MGVSPFSEIKHPKKRAFLVAYSQCGMMTKAAEIAECDRNMHYHWKADPDYLAAWQRAREMAADLHEDEASRRAFGWDEERYTADGTPYTVRKFSDTLLIVRLKALKPDEYRDNVKIEQEVTVHLETSLNQGMKRLEELRNVTPLRRQA